MANTDAPFGLRPISTQAGTAPQMHTYTVASSVTIYEGQPVALDTSGTANTYTGTAAAGDRLLGAAAYYVAGAATDRTLHVYDDPTQEYEIQVDDNSVTLATALIGRNFSFTNVKSGNGTTLQSQAELDGSTGSTVSYNLTVVHPIKGLRFSSDPENDTSAVSWTKVIVKINPGAHIFAAENAGV